MAEVSVLVPVYNGEKYLPQCLDSVISQDFDDWELIAVNDGSTDGTSGILARYSEQDSRIRIISKPNTGQMDSIKTALEQVHTEYVMFLDADDAYKEGMISVLLHQIKATGADCVRGGYVKKSGEQERIELFVKDQMLDRAMIEEQILIPFFEQDADVYHHWSSARWDKIYRADLVKTVYRKYRMDFQLGEDMLFALCCLRECSRAVSMDHAYNYEYRVLPDTLSRGFDQRMYDNYQEYIGRMERFCADCGYSGKAMNLFRDNCYLNMLFELKHTETMKPSEKAAWKKQLQAEIHDRRQLLKLFLKEDFPMKQNLLKLWHKIK